MKITKEFCSNCGAELDPKKMFCSCGKRNQDQLQQTQQISSFAFTVVIIAVALIAWYYEACIR